MKFRNVQPWAMPPTYEVVDDDGTVLGSVMKVEQSYIQFGTITSWRPYLSDGTRVDQLFSTRRDAAQHLKENA